MAIENFRSLTDWCLQDPRVAILTVWCFSTENWKRDEEEVSMLMGLLETYLKKETLEFKKNKIRFVHSGRRDRIPASLKSVIEQTEQETVNETGFTLHLAVDYGGKDEVTRAVNRILSAPRSPLSASSINENLLHSHLDHPELPDIDLILRSSGEQRTSNFFLWQSVYSEWIFSPKYFPDLGVSDLDAALVEYDRRKRRFGS